jgi:trehalose-6-phosphatase
METWLGHLRVGLAAEYGFYYRLPNEQQWQCIGQGLDLSWKDVVHPLMQVLYKTQTLI